MWWKLATGVCTVVSVYFTAALLVGLLALSQTYQQMPIIGEDIKEYGIMLMSVIVFIPLTVFTAKKARIRV